MNNFLDRLRNILLIRSFVILWERFIYSSINDYESIDCSFPFLFLLLLVLLKRCYNNSCFYICRAQCLTLNSVQICNEKSKLFVKPVCHYVTGPRSFFLKLSRTTPVRCRRRIVTLAIVAPLMSRVMLAPPLFAFSYANFCVALPTKSYEAREYKIDFIGCREHISVYM